MNEPTPLSLFQHGNDTAAIAAFLGCSEAHAYNEIHREREEILRRQQRVERQREHNRAYYYRQRDINRKFRAQL